MVTSPVSLRGAPLLLAILIGATACVASSPVAPDEGEGGAGGATVASGPGASTGGGAGGGETSPDASVTTGSGEGGGGGDGGAAADLCPRVRVDVPAGEVLNVRP